MQPYTFLRLEIFWLFTPLSVIAVFGQISNVCCLQVALSEAKKDKASEPVVLYLKVGDQKFVLGTLSRDNIPQFSLDLYLNKEFELSHNSKNASVHFFGYKVEKYP